MKLEQFIEALPSFVLKSTGREYHLRIPNLEDRARFNEWLGTDPEAIGKVFTTMNWDVLSKMVYRLLVEKSDFVAETVKECDDEGKLRDIFVSGPMKLMRAVTGGQQEALSVIECLILAMRKGDPLIDQAMSQGETDKKKAMTSTGGQSLTSSAVNTDTLQVSSPN